MHSQQKSMHRSPTLQHVTSSHTTYTTVHDNRQAHTSKKYGREKLGVEANLQSPRLKSQQLLIGLTLLLSHTQKHTHEETIKRKKYKTVTQCTVAEKLRLKMALPTVKFYTD